MEEQELIRKRELQRLDQMVAYCKTTGCLRACLLNYLERRLRPIAVIAVIATVRFCCRTLPLRHKKYSPLLPAREKKYSSGLGLTLIVRMLHGGRDKRVIQLGLDKLPTYASCMIPTVLKSETI